jgi:hypothetical protein
LPQPGPVDVEVVVVRGGQRAVTRVERLAPTEWVGCTVVITAGSTRPGRSCAPGAR